MYYLRKITRGKWPKESELAKTISLKDIPADTVLAEFVTDNNKLSVWKIENESDLIDAFIALGSNCNSIGSIDAVKIDENIISHLSFDDENGNTPTVGINHKHRNITNYVTLGDVIDSMIQGIGNEGYVHKTRGEMKAILVQAYNEKRIDMEKVPPNMKVSILKAVAKETT